MAKKKLMEKKYEFEYRERKQTIRVFIEKDDKNIDIPPMSVGLTSGKKIMMSNDNDNKKLLFSIGCEMRRFIYKKLHEYNYENKVDYIAVIDGPVKINSKKESFVEMDIQWPNIYKNNFKDNEIFARELVDHFHEQLKRLEV